MASSANDPLNTLTPSDSVSGSRSATCALVVDDEPSIREFLRFALTRQCGFVEVADSTTEARQLMHHHQFDVMVVDIGLPDRSGLDWVHDLRAQGIDTPVVFITGLSETEGCRRTGDVARAQCINKPFALEEMMTAVQRALELNEDGKQDSRNGRTDDSALLQGIVGHSEAMKSLMTLIRRVAGRNSTVLLEGESGTGKEVAARCLHHYSGRRGPFVPVNCGSISPELLESELFGHTKGAFTGATQSREGLFSYADGGTLFLDEICEMPLHLQAKLLRVLEERSIRPVGTERQQTVDVRILAATNKHMADEVTRGTFREDLYFRLNVLALRLPPLRERPADIPHLVKLFSSMLSSELGLEPVRPTEEELHALQRHAWPGNVRELKNLIERAMLLGKSPVECLDLKQVDAPITLGNARSESGYPLDLPLAEVEKRHILRVLAASDGNKSEAARRLGVSRKTLERKVKLWNGS
ncbi:MAG: sigma-54-dependent Fis family transcriptional regulator [Ectothiorhodospiraceae bacterium]|nr:sigma-54-dependent Fis family transcriptional regulator [Ectothiorhodospiraceae bacterium]MCH8505602.1 sigma-54 dependent transcriptional regulator [Ectothiorhodospiraceae bacterium]